MITHIQLHYFKYLLLSALLLSVSFQSCKDDGTEPTDPYSYFPLEVGHYQVYQIEERIYSASQDKPTVSTWQERDEVESILKSDLNSTTYLLVRYKRPTSADYWQKSKEYTVTKFPDRIVTNIDNINTVSMSFPITSRGTWNGNLYNNQDPLEYRYESVNQGDKISDLDFKNTLTVVEQDDSTIINRYSGIKKYAQGTGLISDTQMSYEYCQSDACIGSGKIESGKYLSRKIIETSM